MILGEKITFLRKRNGWSQEELAEKLEVSRQAVSKWESGTSIPDLDKIIKISGIFEVSTDYLLKDEMEEVVFADTKEAYEKGTARSVSLEEANGFMNLIRKLAVKKALAVAVCIVSPICLLILTGLTETGYAGMTDETAAGIGMAVLLLMVAGAVSALIMNKMKSNNFEYLWRENLSLQYGVYGIVEKKKEDFEDTYRRCIVTGVTLCIVGAVPLLVVTGVAEQSEMIAILCLAALLLLVACGVYLFIWSGMIHDSYNMLLQEGDYTAEAKEENKRSESAIRFYWCIVVAIYVGISLWKENWQISWVIWPVAGILFGAYLVIIKTVTKKK